MPDTSAHISEEKLEVRNSIVRHLILTFMAVCLLVAAALAAFAPIPYAEDETFLRVGMGYIGLPVSIGLIVYNVYRIATRRSAILINKEGITDYTSALSSGFTSWDKIKEVYLLRLKSDDYLCAIPEDVDAWMAGLSDMQKRLAQANMEAGFAPIRIQFKKVSDTVTSKDGLDFCKKIVPKKVTHIRKPKY